jgi:hypothetical protein
LAVALAAAVTLAAAPAAARAQAFEQSSVPLEVSGGVTAVWRANPATCAAAGLCGLSGSVSADLGGTGDAELVGVPGRAFLQVLDVFADSPAVVRVRRDTPEGPAFCVDTAETNPFLDLHSAANGRVALPLAEGGSTPLLSSGRCAGPLAADLPPSVVSHPIDSRRLGVRPTTVDMSGRTPLRLGVFTGEVISTLTLRVGRAARRIEEVSGRERRPRRPRLPRTQVVELDYVADGASGALTADFSGLPGPGCAPLDACGASGSVAYSLGRLDETFYVVGHRRVRGGGGGLGFALLALRQGRMDARLDVESEDEDGTNGQGSTGTTSARVTLPDGTVCGDSVTGPVPALAGRRSPSRALKVVLGPPDEGGADVLRTRCPGPEQADVAGTGPAASGTFDSRTLGQPRIDVPLRIGGAFAGPGYAGSRSGEIVLHLRLRHARAEVIGR